MSRGSSFGMTQLKAQATLVLEVLNLKNEYSRIELKDALIQHLAEFLLELAMTLRSWVVNAV